MRPYRPHKQEDSELFIEWEPSQVPDPMGWWVYWFMLAVLSGIVLGVFGIVDWFWPF